MKPYLNLNGKAQFFMYFDGKNGFKKHKVFKTANRMKLKREMLKDIEK